MFGERLQKTRKQLKLSQEDISTQIGISYRAYSSYEREDRKPPIDFLEKLVTQFNINLNYLIAGKGEMFNNSAAEFEQQEDKFTAKVEEILKKKGLI